MVVVSVAVAVVAVLLLILVLMEPHDKEPIDENAKNNCHTHANNTKWCS